MSLKEKFFVNADNRYSYSGIIDKTYKFIEDFQLSDTELWKRFVEQYRENADNDGGWRGEYWGKMMRGATFVYSYTKNEELYNTLEKTVYDLIDSAEESGRLSTYPIEKEFTGWDLWSRKYALLGMQYFLDICKSDELREKIIASMCAQLDYIEARIGEGDKTRITHTSNNWRGLNSSSILEPVVRLYKLTGKENYMTLAKHIVDHGCIDTGDVFELAFKNGLYPYQYPVTKAYEMISCFEGLIEYYEVTGDEKYKTAVVNFADKMLETDFTVIGSGGCTHELFDHSTVRQANTTNGRHAQETCVTVTMMKFMYRLHLLTGDPKYVDAFETSLYNAYLGAVNTEKNINLDWLDQVAECIHDPLPFDSYSPLTADKRGKAIGGLRVMSDKHYYGCCACIGSAGIGLVTKMHLLGTENGFALNLFINGRVEATTPSGKKIAFNTVTEYPKGGSVKISLELEESESFELLVRVPAWSRKTTVSVNGTSVSAIPGYVKICREWQNGDFVELELDMRTFAIRPIIYGEQVLMTDTVLDRNRNVAVVPLYDKQDPLAKYHVALQRGPIMLAQDDKLGYSVDTPIDVEINEDGTVDVEITEGAVPFDNIIEAKLPLTDGTSILVTDYSSAGKNWKERMAVWMLTK